MKMMIEGGMFIFKAPSPADRYPIEQSVTYGRRVTRHVVFWTWILDAWMGSLSTKPSLAQRSLTLLHAAGSNRKPGKPLVSGLQASHPSIFNALSLALDNNFTIQPNLSKTQTRGTPQLT